MEGAIRRWVQAEPDMTLAQLRQRLLKEEIAIKVPALWHQLDKWGLTLKKNSARQRARAQGRRPGAT